MAKNKVYIGEGHDQILEQEVKLREQTRRLESLKKFLQHPQLLDKIHGPETKKRLEKQVMLIGLLQKTIATSLLEILHTYTGQIDEVDKKISEILMEDGVEAK